MLFALASVELRGISDRSPATAFDCCYILPWTLALLQSLTSPHGLVGAFRIELTSGVGSVSKRALLRLALRPVSACSTGKLRSCIAGIDLRRKSRATSYHSFRSGEESERNCPTLPQSDFDASAGFLNLTTSYSFRYVPNVFQPGRTRGVRSLQRFLLLGCRH